MEVVGKDSPLRRVPSVFDPRQRVLLDSIRYCADMVGLCYTRLMAGLHSLSDIAAANNTLPPFTPYFVDAWSLVDAANRITPLLSALSPKTSVGEFEKYANAMADVREMRNSVHHLAGRVDRFVKNRKLAWGSIGWVTNITDQSGKLRSHVIAAGSVTGVRVAFVKPLGRMMRSEIDFVTLYGAETTVDISATVDAVVDIVDYLDRVLGPQFEGKGNAAADAYVSFDIRPNSDSLVMPVTAPNKGMEPIR